MSATSKLVGFSVTSDDEDEGKRLEAQADPERRRYLMRYVVVALGLAGVICVAAGIRVAMTKPAPAPEYVRPALAVPPIADMSRPVTPEPVKPQPEPAVAAVAAAEPAQVTTPPTVGAAPASSTPAPRHVAASAPQAAAAPAHAQAPAAPAHPKAPSSAIIHAAPF
jgi:hypothetical protein